MEKAVLLHTQLSRIKLRIFTSLPPGRKQMACFSDPKILIIKSNQKEDHMKSSMTQATHGGMIINHARFHVTTEKQL